MTSYYSKSEIARWEELQEGYRVIFRAWQEESNAMKVAWEEFPGDETLLPDLIAPEPPVLSLVVYEARIAEEMEEFETPTGNILVMPGRVILTTADGDRFSVSEQELAYGYTPVEDVTL